MFPELKIRMGDVTSAKTRGTPMKRRDKETEGRLTA
jgi:hypothetical protein